METSLAGPPVRFRRGDPRQDRRRVGIARDQRPPHRRGARPPLAPDQPDADRADPRDRRDLHRRPDRVRGADRRPPDRGRRASSPTASSELAETMSERADAITGALAAKTDQVAEAVRQVVTEVTQQLVAEAGDASRALRASASEASTVLGRAVNEIESTLGDRAARSPRRSSSATREFNDVLGARSGELAVPPRRPRQRPPAHARPARHRHRRDGGDPQRPGVAHADRKRRPRRRRSFGGTNERLKTDVADIVDRLAKSNEVLSGLLAGAEGNLLKIESNLSNRASEFGKAIDHAVESTQLSSERTRRPGRASSPRSRARSSTASAAW